jgi:anti-sigma factor RsiW
MNDKLTDLQLRILEKEAINCQDVEDLLGDFTDQELSCTLRGRVDSHIQRCARCQELSSSYQWVVNLAHELKPKPITQGVQSRLRSALNRRLGINLPSVE